MAESSETFAFQAEINQLLSLIINAFYSNKEIFLRELISNASDAVDKIRHLGLQNKEALETCEKLEIKITPDKKNKVLIIEDTGIGMTKQDLIANLGTIAHSGTRGFMESLKDGSADLSLIGQFGVGFYSAYLVADQVRVVTKNNSDKQWVWESNAGGMFTIAAGSEDNLPRGTRIYLHLKDDQCEYLEEQRIKDVVKKHNNYINYPIFLQTEKEVEVEEMENEKDADDGEVEEPSNAKAMCRKIASERINADKPLWMRAPTEITDDEYIAFYKTLSSEWMDPIAWKHFSAEGQLEFKVLLYIPELAPMERIDNRRVPNNMKLYVKRVFIMDECEDLMPEYFGFIKGIVDSNDLPLNVSREMLQQNKIIKQIKKTIVKRVIELLYDLEQNKPEKYKTLYAKYSKNIKHGVYDDRVNRDKLIGLLKYHSSASGSDMISLQQYVDRMKDGQKNIYYMTGESVDSMQQSPFIEALTKKGIEVLFMSEAIDEYMMLSVRDFKDFNFVCCTKDVNLVEASDEEKEEFEKLKAENTKLCEHISNVLGTHNVSGVQISNRLVDTPCVVVTSEASWTANMERIMKAQALQSNNDIVYNAMKPRKILEINPNHKFFKVICKHFDDTTKNNITRDLIWMLYESALLQSGFNVTNPNNFVKRMHRIVAVGLDIDEESDIDEVVSYDNDVEPQTPLEEVD